MDAINGNNCEPAKCNTCNIAKRNSCNSDQCNCNHNNHNCNNHHCSHHSAIRGTHSSSVVSSQPYVLGVRRSALASCQLPPCPVDVPPSVAKTTYIPSKAWVDVTVTVTNWLTKERC